MTIRIASNALVVLAGPSGAGKSTWAKRRFAPNQIVATDDLRAVVGVDAFDQRASADAFALLDDIVARRMKRGLLTVVDTLGMTDDDHERWLSMATRHDRPTCLVRFLVDDKTCRARNRARPRPVPSKVHTAQLATWTATRDELGAEFDIVVDHEDDLVVVPPSLAAVDAGVARQQAAPLHMEFGLHVSAFAWPGGAEGIGERLGDIAAEAEAAGFTSLWVMDHFLQIPQVGREWDPMLESYTTLGFLAGRTSSIRLGTLVTGISYRNVAHLAKTIATLDVLSGGRAIAGLGLGWYAREHAAYGYEMLDASARYELLTDALDLLPLMWGPGSPAFDGTHLSTPEAICYPRPLQEHVPIWIGGSGPRRTLRLVAERADACNLFGEPEQVAASVAALHEHCDAVGRDRAEITISNLTSALCGADRASLDQRVEELRVGQASSDDTASRLNAGTVEDHIGRYRLYAEAGVQHAIVSLADVGTPGSVETFGEVISAFRPDL